MALRDFVITQFKYATPTYSISSLNDIKKIIYLNNNNGTVYKGTQAKIYGFSKYAPYTSIYDWLASQILIYLNDEKTETKISFDAWHDKLCKDFISQCSAHTISVEYGLAQKFVNLALKYCYCFGDSHVAERKNKFAFCHIALDGFTFCPATSSKRWKSYIKYYKMSPAGLQLPFYTEVVNPTVNIQTLPAWSKLNNSKYIEIQNEMRSYFTMHPITYSTIAALDIHSLASCPVTTILTPFQSEFFLWG